MNSNELIEKLQNQLGKNEIESVLEQLKKLFQHTPKLKKVLQQQAKYNRLLEQIHLGTISRDNENVAYNQLFLDLSDIIYEIGKQTTENENLQEEVEKATIHIANSKNVVANSHVSARRDNIMGDQNNHYHYYGDKKVNRFLTLSPSKPSVFMGRDTEMQAIYERLFLKNDNILLLVNGEGGIGKTTLAAAYFHKYKHKYQHLAWVFVATDFINALLSINIYLKVAFPNNATAEQRLALLLHALSELKEPCLLIIDNANDVKELEKYESELRKCTNFHLLLTSRINELDGVFFHKIKPLKKDTAKALFKKHYPKLTTAELPILENILTAIDSNTLVIELLAKSLKQKNRLKKHYQLTALLEDLQTKGLFRLKTDKKVITDWNKQANLTKAKPEAVIAAMYDLEQLDEQEQLLLSNLSVLPAEYLPYDMLEPLLQHIDELDDIVLSLYEKGWLDMDESEDVTKIKVSPVIQAIVRQKNENLFEECQNLIYELIVKLDWEGGGGHLTNASYEEAAIYVEWGEYLITKLDSVNHNFTVLHERIGNFYETTGNLQKALNYFEKDLKLTKELYESYPKNVSFKNGLAISYSKLGQTHSSLGNLQKALNYFEQDLKLTKELYESYPKNVSFKNGLAISYEKLGQTHSSLGNLQKALNYFEQDLKLTKELYESYPKNVSFKNGLAISYVRLYEIYLNTDKEKAITYLRQAYDLFKALAEEYPAYAQFTQYFNIVKNVLEELE